MTLDNNTNETDPKDDRDALQVKVDKIRALFAREEKSVALTRSDIIDEVWGMDALPSERTVDNFILRLRRLVPSRSSPGSPAGLRSCHFLPPRWSPKGYAAPPAPAPRLGCPFGRHQGHRNASRTTRRATPMRRWSRMGEWRRTCSSCATPCCASSKPW